MGHAFTMSADAWSLGEAVWREDLSGTRRLLEEGCDPNVYGGESGTTDTPLMQAVDEAGGFFSADQEEIVRLLLAHGADATLKNNLGWTALHFGVWASDSVIRALIDAGADVNAQSLDGDTPLHEAVRRGAVGAAELLLKSGASRDIKNTIGRIPADDLDESVLSPEEVARLRAALNLAG